MALARPLAAADEETRGRRNVPEDARVCAVVGAARDMASQQAVLAERLFTSRASQRDGISANGLGEERGGFDLVQLVQPGASLEQVKMPVEDRVLVAAELRHGGREWTAFFAGALFCAGSCRLGPARQGRSGGRYPEARHGVGETVHRARSTVRVRGPALTGVGRLASIGKGKGWDAQRRGGWCRNKLALLGGDFGGRKVSRAKYEGGSAVIRPKDRPAW